MSATENTPAVVEDRLVSPVTGTVVALSAPAPDLLAALDELAEVLERAGEYRRALELELVRRVDVETGGTGRTALIDGCKLEVNAPTEDVYSVEDLERELGALADELEAAGDEEGATRARRALEAAIKRPPPKPQDPAVDKRKVNALKASDDRRLLAALAAARRRQSTRRSVKVLGRPVEGTAEEVAGDE